MKAQSYNVLCMVLLIFLVSYCTTPTPVPDPDLDPDIETPTDSTKTPPPSDTITTPTTPTIDYKLVYFNGQDTVPSLIRDTLFGKDLTRLDLKLKNIKESEVIDYTQLEIKPTEGTGTGGKMAITNKGGYVEINLSIDKLTTESVNFGYDVYYKGKKTQHLTHELYQSWIGYSINIMYAQHWEGTTWTADFKATIKPREKYTVYYKAAEQYALYHTSEKGTVKVPTGNILYSTHTFDIDHSKQTQLEPGEYPEYYKPFSGLNGKSIKFPINLTVSGLIFDIWKGKTIVAENDIAGGPNHEKAAISINRVGNEMTYKISFTNSIGRNVTTWEGKASYKTLPVTLEQYCMPTQTQVKHYGTIVLHTLEINSSTRHRPLISEVHLWSKNGVYYLTSVYNSCGLPTMPQSAMKVNFL